MPSRVSTFGVSPSLSLVLSTCATLTTSALKYMGFRELYNRACGFHVSAVLEKADGVISTSQGADFFLLVLGQTACMHLHEMGSYPLRARPPGTTKWTLSLPLMIISSMPLQVLGSSIHPFAICAVMRSPKSHASLDATLRVKCVSPVRILPSPFDF